MLTGHPRAGFLAGGHGGCPGPPQLPPCRLTHIHTCGCPQAHAHTRSHMLTHAQHVLQAAVTSRASLTCCGGGVSSLCSHADPRWPLPPSSQDPLPHLCPRATLTCFRSSDTSWPLPSRLLPPLSPQPRTVFLSPLAELSFLSLQA